MFEGPEDDPMDGTLLDLFPGAFGALFLVPTIGVALILVGFGLAIPGVIFLGLVITGLSSLLLYWSFTGPLRPYLGGESRGERYPAPPMPSYGQPGTPYQHYVPPYSAPSPQWHHRPGPYDQPVHAPHAQAVAPGQCQTCGSTLHYGKLFCPHCSAPIFRTDLDGPAPPEL